MAGYNGYSKSNNAIAAEEQGKETASALARRIGGGATAAAIAKCVPACEWHHTSKHFNRTFYYDFDAAVEERAEREGISENAAHDLFVAEIRAASQQENAQIFEGCNVRWIEWSGSRRHPRATHHETISDVIYKGGQFVEFQDGATTIRKKIGANGFVVKRNGLTLISDFIGKNF